MLTYHFDCDMSVPGYQQMVDPLKWTMIQNSSQQRNHIPGDFFESQFDREILIGERLRATILAAFFFMALVTWIVITVAFPAVLERVFHGKLDPTWVPGLVLGVVIYELGVRILLGHFINTGKSFPVLARYGNAFIDASIPTIALVIYSQFLTPSAALFSPWPFFYFLFILLSALRLDFKLCYFTGAVAAVEYTVLALILIRGSSVPSIEPMLVEPMAHIVKGFSLISAGLVAGFVTLEIKKRIKKSLRSVEERNRVVGIFGQHVSPAVVDKLLDQNADVEGEIRRVFIMFLDIRNFTTYAEHKKPEEVISYLNTLFEFMVEIVNRNNGIINKFLADGFMAVFGAPLSDGRDSQNAVSASLEILDSVKAEFENGTIPDTRVGIGLHAGDAVIGNVGSAQRKEYTIIGDVVNTASRIEQLNKKFKSQILISREVWKSVGENLKDAEYLGEILVKGREEPIQIYKLA